MRMVRQTSIALSLKGTGTRKEEAKEAGKVPLDQLFAEDEDAPLHMTRTQTTRGVMHNIESDGLTSELAAELLRKFGRNELPEKKKAKWLIVSACLPAFLPACLFIRVELRGFD